MLLIGNYRRLYFRKCKGKILTGSICRKEGGGMWRLLMGTLVAVVYPFFAQASEPFHGSYRCSLVATTGTAGFKVGSEIVLGVAPSGELAWISNLGVGLNYECSPSGYILICPVNDTPPQQQIVLDTRSLSMVRQFKHNAHEEWSCERFPLAEPR